MIAIKKIKNPQIALQLIRLLMSEGQRIFNIEQARIFAERLHLQQSYLVEALYYLKKAGWIFSLHRGLYAICNSVSGMTPIHEFEIAMALINPAALSHWSALHYHGLTDQIPRTIFVLTTASGHIPRHRRFGSVKKEGYAVGDFTYQFISIKAERFFGLQKIWIGETSVLITDPERTLLDGLAAPQYFGDIAEILDAFRQKKDSLDVEKIISYALLWDAAVIKRLGWVLENLGIPQGRLQSLLDFPIKGYRTLDASGPRKGPYNSRWMIQENLPGKIK